MSVTSKKSETSTPDIENTIKIRTADNLDNEFRYYTKLIQDLILTLNSQDERKKVLPWVRKLSEPGYNVTQLRDKRNRYMLMLCLSITTDSLEPPFDSLPPTGILTDLMKIPVPKFKPYDWEIDSTWEDEITNYKNVDVDAEACDIEKKEMRLQCPVHRKICPRDSPLNRNIGLILDKQFRFLLYVSKPYAALLYRAADKFRAARWIQSLCLIGPSLCPLAKGIRNDYMMVLVGYLSNRCLIGPFQEFPLEKLLPLPVVAKLCSEKKPITDPTHPRTAEFFMDVPHPDEGAFALITVTGDLYDEMHK